MGDAGDFQYKVLIKATRANNATAGAPGVLCEQDVLSSRVDLRERVAEAVEKAVSLNKSQPMRVRVLVQVIRRADGKKEALKQICSSEELPTVAAALAVDIATALAGDPLPPSPGALLSSAKDFAKSAHDELKSAAEWIRPVARPAAAPETATAAAAAAEGAPPAPGPRRVARPARVNGAPPTADASAMFGNVLTNVLNNVLKNPENLKRAAEFGKTVAASLPQVPIKPV